MKRIFSTFLLLALVVGFSPASDAAGGYTSDYDRVRVSEDTQLLDQYYPYKGDGTYQSFVPTGFTFHGTRQDINMTDIKFRGYMDLDYDQTNGGWGEEAGVELNDAILAVRLLDEDFNPISSYEAIDAEGYVEFDRLYHAIPARSFETIYLDVMLHPSFRYGGEEIWFYFDIEDVHNDVMGETDAGVEKRISDAHPDTPNSGRSSFHVLYTDLVVLDEYAGASTAYPENIISFGEDEQTVFEFTMASTGEDIDVNELWFFLDGDFGAESTDFTNLTLHELLPDGSLSAQLGTLNRIATTRTDSEYLVFENTNIDIDSYETKEFMLIGDHDGQVYGGSYSIHVSDLWALNVSTQTNLIRTQDFSLHNYHRLYAY